MSQQSIEHQVIAFAAEFTGRPAKEITLRTTLFGDLGIAGDDGREFLAAFATRFDVEMRACPPVHFGSEGLFPWFLLYWLVLLWRAYVEKGSTPESRARLVPITIQDLVDSAEARRWALTYDE
jgi:hypothetical protein